MDGFGPRLGQNYKNNNDFVVFELCSVFFPAMVRLNVSRTHPITNDTIKEKINLKRKEIVMFCIVFFDFFLLFLMFFFLIFHVYKCI